MDTLSLLFLAALGIFYFAYHVYKSNKKPKNQNGSTGEGGSHDKGVGGKSDFNLDSAIIDLSLHARLEGVHKETRFEELIDSCLELNNELLKARDEEAHLVKPFVNDYQRMVEKHLPELVQKFGKINDPSSKQVEQFNNAMSQLISETERVLNALREKNYKDFGRKAKFTQIRYSDQY